MSPQISPQANPAWLSSLCKLLKEWRALVDDFRTFPIGPIVADLPTGSDLPMG